MGSFAEEEWCALCRLFRERVHCVIDIQLPQETMTEMTHDWALILNPVEGFAHPVGYILRHVSVTTTDAVYDAEGTGPQTQRIVQACTSWIPEERIVHVVMDPDIFQEIDSEWDEFRVSSTAMMRWIGKVWDKLPEAFR